MYVSVNGYRLSSYVGQQYPEVSKEEMQSHANSARMSTLLLKHQIENVPFPLSTG
jgi:hypothetical protein